MTTATEITGADLANWVQGARFFSTDDGRYFIVDADLTDWGPGVTVVRRPTHIIFTDERGGVLSAELVSDFTTAPGTAPEDAISAAGFTLSGGGS